MSPIIPPEPTATLPRGCAAVRPPWRDGQKLDATFTVRKPFQRVSRNGQRFMTCRLETEGLTLPAYAWAGECEGYQVPRHGERVYAAGRLRWRDGRFELVCGTLQAVDVAGRIRAARALLRQLLEDLAPAALGTFLRQVFQDPRILPPFVVAPASLNHHHTFSGGLLVHSAEVAGMVYRWSADSPLRGLATAAALLHDIGKVRTLAGNRTSTALGQVVRHEDLTLEVLADHLRRLDAAWAEGGILLRHLLTAQPRLQAPSPAYAALELVRTADRVSAREQLDAGVLMPRATPQG